MQTKALRLYLRVRSLVNMGPGPTFALSGGPCCPTLDFAFAFWIMIAFDTLLTSLFYIILNYFRFSLQLVTKVSFLSYHRIYNEQLSIL
jgi:hypothetical protein